MHNWKVRLDVFVNIRSLSMVKTKRIAHSLVWWRIYSRPFVTAPRLLQAQRELIRRTTIILNTHQHTECKYFPLAVGECGKCGGFGRCCRRNTRSVSRLCAPWLQLPSFVCLTNGLEIGFRTCDSTLIWQNQP